MSEKFRGRPDQSKPYEINEGVVDHRVEVAEFADESPEEDWRREEKNKPEVLPEVSARNLENGRATVKEIITQVRGEFIGAYDDSEPYEGLGGAFRREKPMSITVSGEEAIINKLAAGRWAWKPLYDDLLVMSGSSSGDGSNSVYYIGDNKICSENFYKLTDAEPFFSVCGQPVTSGDYTDFVHDVQEMLNSNYKKRDAKPRTERLMPNEIAVKVQKIYVENRTSEVIKNGTVVQAGTIQLKDGPYGSSYFGSGGGYGSVQAFDLAEWRKGKRVKKEVATKDRDNGFVSGIDQVTIVPNTVVICKGGDSIGGAGRSSEEIYICE